MAESWVGGDLAGLRQMGGTMKAAPAELGTVVHALAAKVDSLVGDAGWQGDAADEFRKTWSTNSIQAGALSDVVGQVGGIVDDLGAKLQDIENAIYNAAHAAAKQGVPIGADGRLGPMASADQSADPQVVATRQAASDYSDTYESAMRLAKGYRLNAANQLSGIYDQISFDPGKTPMPDQWVTIGDYLRGLYTLPGERNAKLLGKLPGEVADAQGRMKGARKSLKQARAEYQAKGMKLPVDNDARLEHSSAVKELKGLETELASAEAGIGELPFTKVFNFHLGEIPQLGAIADALPKGLEFLKDIPVIDVAAAGVAAEFQSRDDIDKGWTPDHARSVDYGAAGIGLVGGTAVGLGAVAMFSAPEIAAGLGAGIAAVGIGDFAYQGFHEHWSEDIHQDGVVGGLLAGIGHTGQNTGKDVASAVTGVWHGAENLWHSVFG